MIYRLHGTIQPYAWGGHDYIPQLLRREPSNLPAAELWFGDHPQAPSQIEADGITLPFNDWLQKNLNQLLLKQQQKQLLNKHNLNKQLLNSQLNQSKRLLRANRPSPKLSKKVNIMLR